MAMLELETLYRENVSLIFRYFRLRTFSKEVAEDLTSEVFLRFAAKYEVNSTRAYLYGIAKLVFLEYLKKKYKQELPLGDEIANFASHVEDFVSENNNADSRQKMLRELIEKLPEKQKEVIQLRLNEHLDISEICEKLGKDSNYVRTTQKRALANLKKLWACTQLTTSNLELTSNHE